MNCPTCQRPYKSSRVREYKTGSKVPKGRGFKPHTRYRVTVYTHGRGIHPIHKLPTVDECNGTPEEIKR